MHARLDAVLHAHPPPADRHAAIGGDLVAITAAEKMVDRLVEQAALEIPQGDVDAGDRVGQGAARPEVVVFEKHPVPEFADIERVFPHHLLGQTLIDERLHERRAVIRTFAPAGEAGVADHLDEDRTVDNVGVDRGDLGVDTRGRSDRAHGRLDGPRRHGGGGAEERGGFEKIATGGHKLNGGRQRAIQCRPARAMAKWEHGREARVPHG